jgi:TonB family protein
MAGPMSDPQGDLAFRRMMKWSVGVHVGVIVLALVVPRDWLKEPEPKYMTVNLGGGPVGPVTTGTSPVGGKTVETVAPPPKRPEPVRPPTAPPPPVAATLPKAAPVKPVDLSKAAPPAPRPTPPATGRQVSQGGARVDTGTSGDSQGLTSSLMGGLQADIDATFCCPEWTDIMIRLIQREWNDNQSVRGTSILLFTVQKDGSVTDISVPTSSGDRNLEFEARRTMATVKLPPLPAAYPETALRVRLRFPYGGG